MKKLSNKVALLTAVCFVLGAETLGANIFAYSVIFIIPLYAIWELLLIMTKKANGEEW